MYLWAVKTKQIFFNFTPCLSLQLWKISQDVPQTAQYAYIRKTNSKILYRETITVYCNIHMKDINTDFEECPILVLSLVEYIYKH